MSWPLFAFLILHLPLLPSWRYSNFDVLTVPWTHQIFCCNFLTIPMMFPLSACSPNYSSSSVSNAVWFLSCSYSVHTSVTAWVFMCYDYTWAFAPLTGNLELNAGGHAAVCGWRPSWLISHLFWLVGSQALQLLNILNISSSLLLSIMWHSEGAQKYLLILELGMTECLSYSWLESHLTLLLSPPLVVLHWARCVPLSHPLGLPLYFNKTNTKCIAWQTFTYL